MAKKRSIAARIGIALLNLVASGLGLLRLGYWKLAAGFLCLSMGILWFFSLGPLVPFPVLLLIVLVGLSAFVAAMALSWWKSRTLPSPYPRYSRWYSIVGVGLIAVTANILLTDKLHYRSFYTASDSMAPTLPKNDRLIAFMGSIGPLRRGDLVMVRTARNEVYVKRVAAIAGDRFAMKDGSVILNGSAVPQRPVGYEKVRDVAGDITARKLSERLPGEPSSHQIYDLGKGPGDDFAEVLIPSGFVMLLGDHRDRSADGRFPVETGGLGGPVAIKDIVGRPIYQSWRSSQPMGTKLFN